MLNKEYKANLEKIKRRGADREKEKIMKVEDSHKFRHPEEKMKRSRKDFKEPFDSEKKNKEEKNKKHERIDEGDKKK